MHWVQLHHQLHQQLQHHPIAPSVASLCTLPMYLGYTPFFGQFRRQCMRFGNSADNVGGSAVRWPVGHDSAAAMSKLVALLPNYMQIVQNWSEKGVRARHRCCPALWTSLQMILHPLRFLSGYGPGILAGGEAGGGDIAAPLVIVSKFSPRRHQHGSRDNTQY